MSFNINKLKQIVEELKNDLGDGFVATDIWATADAQPIVGFNSQPKAAALFNEVTRKLDMTLKESKYSGLGNYYFVNLDNNKLVMVLSIGSYQQFILVDLLKTTIGILMNVALPNLLSGLAEVEDLAEAATQSMGGGCRISQAVYHTGIPG